MATSLTLENDSSLAQGYLKVNGSTAATLTTSGITGNLTGNVTGNLSGSLTSGGSLTLGTAQTASGTSVDFTGIPSWVKRITVMFDGVSTNGTSNYIIQLGTSLGFQTSNYIGGSSYGTQAYNSTGFLIGNGIFASSLRHSGISSLLLLGSNIWTQNGTFASNSTNNHCYSAGSTTLSNVLDRIRITTVNGTDTFDAGTINISYEG